MPKARNSNASNVDNKKASYLEVDSDVNELPCKLKVMVREVTALSKENNDAKMKKKSSNKHYHAQALH